MPFVTVVSLGASAASDYISSAVRANIICEGSGKSTLTRIRSVCEDEIYNDISQSPHNNHNSHNNNIRTIGFSDGVSKLSITNNSNNSRHSKNHEGNGEVSSGSRRKSVSFVDLSSVGKLSMAPPSESADSCYSSGSGSSSSSACSTVCGGPLNSNGETRDRNRDVTVWCDKVYQGKENGHCLNSGNGISQGKATVWKSWIRNKLSLSKNGKYSLAGSLSSLNHFGIKANKSLLVDYITETECSTRKYYVLNRIPNENTNLENSQEILCDIQDGCNLFVRECLKTYSTPFLELQDHHQLDDEDVVDSNGFPSPKKDNNSSSLQIPSLEVTTTAAKKAPDWFWSSWNQARGTQLDEAGIALEGRVVVIHKEENLGDRFIQVKWDDVEEKFNFIVWTLEAGRNFVCKVDLNDVDCVWHSEHKLTLDKHLVLHSEQRKGLLRDLFVICSELGCFEKASYLASSRNVERVDNIVGLFQHVAVELSSSSDKKSNVKSIGKPKTQSPTLFSLRLDCLEFRLKTETGTPIEPYYVLISLFDVKNGRKITEDYHCSVDIRGKVVDNNKAIFRVSEANEQIYAVVRVEKTLQATDSDVYLRGNPDGKTGSRISKSVLSSPLYSTTQRYRMPLCWSARPIFRKTVSHASQEVEYTLDTETSFSPFYKHDKSWDEELIKVLAEIKKPEKVSKLTLIPGVLKVSLDPIPPDQVVELTKNKETSTSIIEFPYHSSENFSRFVHNLYVYPVQVNLNALGGGKIRARNILVRVFLRSEDDIDASPLEPSPVDGRIATYVLHHRTNPEFYSEIKLELPVALDPRLHLLFQFLHISCSFDKVGKQVENIIGYSWIPLLNKFRFLGGEHMLPIAMSLPPNYLSIMPLGLGKGSQSEDLLATDRISQKGGPQFSRSHKKRLVLQQYSGPDIQWLDKCSLTVKLNLISTVWTKCGSLGAFFAHAEKFLQKGVNAAKFHCDDENTVKAIRSLENIDLSTHRDFYPTITNQICTVATISKTVASAALKFFIFSSHALIEAGLQSIIEHYVQKRFLSTFEGEQIQNGPSSPSLADVFVDAWIDIFEVGDGATIASSLEQSRHLFSMIVKSIAVQGMASCTNAEDSKIVKLIHRFTTEVVQRCQSDHALSLGANSNLVDFICSMLSIITQRHIVFAAINSYLSCFGPGDSYKVQDFKFSLLMALVEHPLFLELNRAVGDDETTRLENIPWARRHFLVATVMKQSRSGLGEVSNVRSLALKPIMLGLTLHEERSKGNPMWVPWLRVVCDNLHRIISLSTTSSSRCSSVSTVLSATSSSLIRAALSKNMSNDTHSTHNHCQKESQYPALGGLLRGGGDSTRSSTLSVKVPPSVSQNSSMTNINSIGGEIRNGGPGTTVSDRMSLDRMSLTNCDYLEAISAIKTSNPAASSVAPSTVSCGSGTETIVNESGSNNGSGDGQSIGKESNSEIGEDEALLKTASQAGTNTEADKSHVVLRRYDKLNDVETSQLLISGLYLLKTIGKDGLRNFWLKSTTQERASLLQMIHLACAHFTNARKNSTITRKKVVGIVVPPTMPPSPRASYNPLSNKKWSSLPSKTTDDIAEKANGVSKTPENFPNDAASFWRALSTECTFICVDTLADLCFACKGEVNEMRDVIRTSLDVAKASEDTRAMLGALENILRIDELAAIVFAKGNEDLTHHLFCELLNGFGVSYLINVCVNILGKLFLFDGNRTTSQSLLAISSLTITPGFVSNFRKSLALLERNISVNERSSFVLSITEKLSFIDLQEFETTSTVKTKCSSSSSTNSFKSLNSSGTRSAGSKSEKKLAKNSLPTRLSTILNSLWLLKSCTNPYRTAELYLKLANSYSHYAKARLRIDAFTLLREYFLDRRSTDIPNDALRFDSMKDEHSANKRYSEALLCELHVAARLTRHSAATPEVRKIMLGISQNLKAEFEEIDDAVDEEDSTEELIQRLENCVHLCEKSERYELMLEVYRMLVDIQENLSDYAALEHCYKQMSRACALIQNKRERFLATYYRVAFYHPKKDLLSRPIEVYVYKEPNVTSLMEICNKIEMTEGAQIVSGETDQLPDNDILYATITHVSPVPSPQRKLWSIEFRKHQNLNKFIYDTPFAVKSQSDRISVDNKAAVNQQWKRRTTITTEFSFPACVPRLRVVQSEEEDLSPIIVAIDDMQRRVVELRSELHSQDIKRIQLRLQGSVSVQVNQGPLAYARAFLEKENDYPFEDIHRLKNIFRDFVECCGELLIRNGKLITPDQIDYQRNLESDYAHLCSALGDLNLNLPESLNARMSRISISSY